MYNGTRYSCFSLSSLWVSFSPICLQWLWLGIPHKHIKRLIGRVYWGVGSSRCWRLPPTFFCGGSRLKEPSRRVKVNFVAVRWKFHCSLSIWLCPRAPRNSRKVTHECSTCMQFYVRRSTSQEVMCLHTFTFTFTFTRTHHLLVKYGGTNICVFVLSVSKW